MHEILIFLSSLFVNAMVGYNIVLINRYMLNNKLQEREWYFILSFAISISILRQFVISGEVAIIATICRYSIFAITFVLIYFILRIKIWKTVLLFCITMVSQGLGEMIVLGVVLLQGIDVGDIIKGRNLLLFIGCNIAINLLQILIILIFKVWKNIKNISAGLRKKTYIMIAVNIILLIMMLTISVSAMVFSREAVNSIIAFVVMSFIMLICSIYSVGMMLDTDFRDEKLKMQESYNEVLKEFRHKFLGIISILTALSEDGNTDNLNGYIKELNQSFVGRIKNVPVNIENSKLLYLVSIKTGEAYDKGITVKTLVPFEIKDIKGINEDDFIYVLNELMSNAIEHAGESMEKEVTVRIENLPDRLKVVVENSINKSVSENKYNILNGEAKKDGRGYGLKQVQKLIGENAYFKMGISDRFIAELVLKK